MEGSGLTCSTFRLGREFADIRERTFNPEGVIYGKFLALGTEAAAVSGHSFDGHPALDGGTLLLTKRNSEWVPLWYRSSVLTHSCQRMAMPSGRELLLCEEEHGGMSHQFHYIYYVDLLHPQDIRDTVLVAAHSFDDGCTLRRQVIQRLAWVQETRVLSVTLQTPEWRYSSTPDCAGLAMPGKRPPPTLTFEFELTNDGFRPLHQQEFRGTTW